MGSWSAKGAVQVKVQAKPNEPSAERIPPAPCQRIPLEKTRVCTPRISTHINSRLSPHLSFYVFICDVIFLFVVGWSEALPDTPVDEMPPGPEVPEKIKKRYRKKKTKLEEAFPAYLQVCHLL